MSIAPEEFLPYIHAALDGRLHIVEELGNARMNQRPANMAVFPLIDSAYADGRLKRYEFVHQDKNKEASYGWHSPRADTAWRFGVSGKS